MGYNEKFLRRDLVSILTQKVNTKVVNPKYKILINEINQNNFKNDARSYSWYDLFNIEKNVHACLITHLD